MSACLYSLMELRAASAVSLQLESGLARRSKKIAFRTSGCFGTALSSGE